MFAVDIIIILLLLLLLMMMMIIIMIIIIINVVNNITLNNNKRLCNLWTLECFNQVPVSTSPYRSESTVWDRFINRK